MGIVIIGALGQSLQGWTHWVQHGRQRQLKPQLVHLGEVVAQRHLRLTGQGQAQRVGGDKRVAVSVATDPVPHAEKRSNALARQSHFQRLIQARNFPQKRGVVVTQGVVDLIGHAQFGKAQQSRAPQL